MEFGLLLPAGRAQLAAGGDVGAIVDLACEAERLRFDSVWAGDSIVRARIEPLTLLTAVAQATDHVTLGTAVLLPAFRHPVQAALTVTSLDLISGGRLVLGVGAGFPGFSEPEFELVGVRFKTRFSHLDDVVRLWRELWSGNPRSFHGKVLRYDWLPDVPRPAREGGPPIWLAGATPSALRRAGELYDGWLPYPPAPADYARGLAAIRPSRPFTPALFATVYVDDDAGRGTAVLEEYAKGTYQRPLSVVGGIQTMLTGPAPVVAAGLHAYADAGADHVLIRIGAIDPSTVAEQLPRIAEIVAQLT
ncbi:LLM class flavin-dependent oxidoreductase [Amycolatopsis sp. FDAARGOS 1241]|uniref:LLM class flavin-dependent oxidoreductase n=1 Tax=Amycolatopsis sp. FDAARGOS 1241 TaxID=2778070 RepID=UPI00195214E1|nr:LLM class flavin-dependent oxidoreductase [Amycolatopsis sp. FDAARGOS 1241]QRP47028.1 LLM class flavin-dependent oxidoreductase [Amycolatopsis sp. FDAARGOS 1241]